MRDFGDLIFRTTDGVLPRNSLEVHIRSYGSSACARRVLRSIQLDTTTEPLPASVKYTRGNASRKKRYHSPLTRTDTHMTWPCWPKRRKITHAPIRALRSLSSFNRRLSEPQAQSSSLVLILERVHSNCHTS